MARRLHELDVALDLARQTGTFNVLLEFLHYDRSIVLDALGDSNGARASYRRYLRLVGGQAAPRRRAAGTGKRPLETPFPQARGPLHATTTPVR
jgi:hypothetical protein